MPLLPVLLAPLALTIAPASALAQEPPARELPPPPAALDADAVYPPERNTTLLRFYSIEGKLDPEALRKAIAELGTPEVEARIVYGPESTPARPGRFFLALEAPATLAEKDVTKAVKRGAATVELAAFTCFQGSARELPDDAAGRRLGLGVRDWLLGMSNDLRWADANAGWYEYFFVPGKLDAKTIADRFAKLFGPFGVSSAGTLVREGFTWSVASPCDEATAKKVEKALAKLPGVRLARLDVAAKTLTVQFELDDLSTSGPAVPAELLARAAGREPPAADARPPTATKVPRVRFDVNPILDVLEKAKVGVARVASPAAAGGGADGR
jgi:hypothetical protein